MTYAKPNTSPNATRYEPTTKATTRPEQLGYEPTQQLVTSVAKENEAHLILGLLITSTQANPIPSCSQLIAHATQVEETRREPPPAVSGGGAKLKTLLRQSTPAVHDTRGRETHLPPRLGEWQHLALADRMVGHQNQSSLIEGTATHQN